MNNKEQINKLVDEALSSLDGAERATPKPYLFTRLNARMQNEPENSWDTVLKFISRPVIALAGLCLVITINAAVVSSNYSAQTTTTVADEQYASADEYTTSVAVLSDVENIEP
jgi:hypothetical protein